MIWLITGLLLTGNSPELVLYKEVEYYFASTLSWGELEMNKKCTESPAIMAFAFARKEQWQARNNPFWLRHDDKKYAPMFQTQVKEYSPNKYRKYSHQWYGIYDWMYRYYYLMWCSFSPKKAWAYKNWPRWGMWGADLYYQHIMNNVKYYKRFTVNKVYETTKPWNIHKDDRGTRKRLIQITLWLRDGLLY